MPPILVKDAVVPVETINRGKKGFEPKRKQEGVSPGHPRGRAGAGPRKKGLSLSVAQGSKVLVQASQEEQKLSSESRREEEAGLCQQRVALSLTQRGSVLDPRPPSGASSSLGDRPSS